MKRIPIAQSKAPTTQQKIAYNFRSESSSSHSTVLTSQSWIPLQSLFHGKAFVRNWISFSLLDLCRVDVELSSFSQQRPFQHSLACSSQHFICFCTLFIVPKGHWTLPMATCGPCLLTDQSCILHALEIDSKNPCTHFVDSSVQGWGYQCNQGISAPNTLAQPLPQTAVGRQNSSGQESLLLLLPETFIASLLGIVQPCTIQPWAPAAHLEGTSGGVVGASFGCRHQQVGLFIRENWNAQHPHPVAVCQENHSRDEGHA